MKCQQAQQLIHEYVDQQVSGQSMTLAPFDSLSLHFDQCVACAEKLRQEQQFRQLLTQLNKSAPVPPPSAGFIDRALRSAVEQKHVGHQVSHRQGFIKGFGSALAAGLALWVVVSALPTHENLKAPSELSNDIVTISLQEPTNVNLAFHSLKDVQDATITIRLSDNLQLVGYQDRQTLEWKTNLVAGDNVLTLPVKALKPQQGKIIAQISHNNLHKSIELTLDVKSDTNANKPGISDNYNIVTPVV